MLDEFMETLQERWDSLLEGGNCFAIDESMIPWYGKYCPIRVYIKGKPYKYGMKLWQLDDWPTGYCRGFRMYPGRGTDGHMRHRKVWRVVLRGEGGDVSHQKS